MAGFGVPYSTLLKLLTGLDPLPATTVDMNFKNSMYDVRYAKMLLIENARISILEYYIK